jgi:nitrous oxidase accessory protein NosD
MLALRSATCLAESEGATMRRTLGLGFVFAITMSLGITANTASAAGTTRWVNDNSPAIVYVTPGTSCNNPGYPTIQGAVNASGPGDRINVCPGSYPEQVVVAAPKNNLSLRSVSVWQAVIKAPLVMLPDGILASNTIVRVDGAQNVQILAFTIMGPGPAGCGTLHYGVKVVGGGSADIFGNHIAHIRDNPFSGCQNGVGVQIGRNGEGTTGSARVIGNLINDYQKNGLTVDNVGSYAEVAYNLVVGAGPTVMNAQNGVQVSRGATARVRQNFISSNDYIPTTNTGTGILLFQPGVVSVERNTVNLNGTGIYDYAAGIGTGIKNNSARASRYEGIVLDDLTGQRVEANKSSDNAGPGIGLYDAFQNTIKSNWVTSNRDTGILLDSLVLPTFGSNQNSVRYNVVTYNGTAGTPPDTTDGIRINLGSTLNAIDSNRLKRNITHDCHDENPPGDNTWTNNEAQTSFPAGLCDEDEHADKDCTDSQHGWDRSYKWNAEFGVPIELDFTTAYASAVDVDALVASLPPLPTNIAKHSALPSN